MKKQMVVGVGAFFLLCQLALGSQVVVAATAEEDSVQYEELQEYDERGGIVEEGGYEQDALAQDQYEMQEPTGQLEEGTGPELEEER